MSMYSTPQFTAGFRERSPDGSGAELRPKVDVHVFSTSKAGCYM